MTPREFIALCLILVPVHANAEIHKCIGEDGVTLFQGRPCDDASSSFKPLAEPAGTANPDQRLDKTRKLLRAYEDERRQQRDQQAREKAEKADRERKCNQARDRLRNINAAGNLYRINEDGKRELLSNEERDRAVQRAQQEIEKRCD
ncbi:MAG: DUF4124 domain-containing protein [Gammaproteobacteria bacterium]|nr:DUF4124 domain-containing protein [Gammaproteobacteria bacterium]